MIFILQGSSSEESDSKYNPIVELPKSLTKGRAPPASTISKISMNLKSNASTKPGINIKLNSPANKPIASVAPKPLTVASAFNNDSDDEAEEMPQECKMRMRNIGKNTPTSSGPNSFGKTKLGFVDSKKIFEKKMQEMLKDLGD